ncbi:MAG: twin transmembrane helix small protein [Hyphomicrobium sp.]
MAAHYDESHRIVISEEDARGGATGHNVRYVLAYGLTGVVAMFAAIAIYAGFDRLHSKASAALAQNPSEVLQAFAPYAGIVLVGALAIGLLLGVWNLIAGRSEDGSQSFMRFRVAVQFAAICVIMAILYVSSLA